MSEVMIERGRNSTPFRGTCRSTATVIPSARDGGILVSLSLNLGPVAAPRQSAVKPRNHFLRRSAETPLRRGSWSQCRFEKTWRLSMKREPRCRRFWSAPALWRFSAALRPKAAQSRRTPRRFATNEREAFPRFMVTMHAKNRTGAPHGCSSMIRQFLVTPAAEFTLGLLCGLRIVRISLALNYWVA